MFLPFGKHRCTLDGQRYGLRFAVFQTLHQRTHPQPQRAYIVYIVNLEQCNAFASTFQYLVHLVDNKSVGTATKRCQLHKMYILGSGSHIMGCPHHSVWISPLRNSVDFVKYLFVRKQCHIFGNDIYTHIRYRIGYLMLYKRIYMIRTPTKQYYHTIVFLGLLHYMSVFFGHRNHIAVLFFQGFGKSTRGHLLIHTKRHKVFYTRLCQKVLVVKRHSRRVQRYIIMKFGINGTFKHIGVAGYNRTYIAVARLGALQFVKHSVRIQYPIHPLFHKIHHMAVHQLGRKTNIVGHNRTYTFLVKTIGRCSRQNRLYITFRQQGKPKRIVLIHYQSTRYAYLHQWFFVHLLKGSGKQQSVTLLILVNPFLGRQCGV